MHHAFHHRLAAAAGIALVLALSACGGGSSADAKVATLGSTATDDATNDPAADVDSQEAILAYAACMRENGVDMEDPTFDAEGNVSGGGFGPGSGLDPGSDEFQTAQTACGDLIEGVEFGRGGGGGGGGLDIDAIQTAMNDFTACLRDEGLEVDDVTMGGGAGGGAPNGSFPAGGPNGDGSLPPGGFDGGPNGVPPEGGQGGGPGAGGFDPTAMLIAQLGLDDTDPAVTAALEICQPLMENAFQPPTTEA